jgi:hypothetical protein
MIEPKQHRLVWAVLMDWADKRQRAVFIEPARQQAVGNVFAIAVKNQCFPGFWERE